MDPCTMVVTGAGAAATIVLVPAGIAAAGFTSAGIVAGSIGAWLMSTTALATGGVAAGSVVAVLQSVGAAGFSAAGQVALGAVGATLGGVASLICNSTAS